MGASSGSEVASCLSAQCCLSGDSAGTAQGLCHPAPVVIAGGGGWWGNGTSARTTASAGGGVCDNCTEGRLLWAAVTSIMLYSVNISSWTWCVVAGNGRGIVSAGSSNGLCSRDSIDDNIDSYSGTHHKSQR